MLDTSSQASRRVWLVTGSSRGFGRELVKAALDHGDFVVATARQPHTLDDLSERYGLERLLPVALDVTDAESARSAVTQAIKNFGRLDVVVNNAGYADSAPIEEMSEHEFRAQIETNLFGVVNVSRAALPVLRSQRSGLFFQFSSVGGRVGGTPGLGAYQAAKFAVEGFSEVLANEVKPFGVRVVIVEPGAFRTDWQGSSMVMHQVESDYEATVGAIHAFRRESQGHQAGDPARAAQILVDLAGREVVPLRLPLGSAAVDQILANERNRIAETTEWAEVSRAADFPSNDQIATETLRS